VIIFGVFNITFLVVYEMTVVILTKIKQTFKITQVLIEPTNKNITNQDVTAVTFLEVLFDHQTFLNVMVSVWPSIVHQRIDLSLLTPILFILFCTPKLDECMHGLLSCSEFTIFRLLSFSTVGRGGLRAPRLINSNWCLPKETCAGNGLLHAKKIKYCSTSLFMQVKPP